MKTMKNKESISSKKSRIRKKKKCNKDTDRKYNTIKMRTIGMMNRQMEKKMTKCRK